MVAAGAQLQDCNSEAQMAVAAVWAAVSEVAFDLPTTATVHKKSGATRTCTPKQVELDSHLGCHGGVTEGSTLMCREDAKGVVPVGCNANQGMVYTRHGIYRRL
jgi:hypothetical protein